jgi:hypothetical protein
LILNSIHSPVELFQNILATIYFYSGEQSLLPCTENSTQIDWNAAIVDHSSLRKFVLSLDKEKKEENAGKSGKKTQIGLMSEHTCCITSLS